MNKFICMSTTSKKGDSFRNLPTKNIKSYQSKNILFSEKKSLWEYININKSQEVIYISDCEKKQGFSIYDELINEDINQIDYKPNDLTLEAADLTILNYFNRNINGKSIAIYGTGNLAFKLALRLSERNANVYIYGRDVNKIQICVEALKQITFESELIHYGSKKIKVDCLASFVNSEKIIDEQYLSILKSQTLCLDGGIGNFSESFIKKALKNNHEVRRLDVRQSQEIMDGYINSRLSSTFEDILGRDIVDGYSLVAGGIIGKKGEIVVDKIKNPSKVIGIANGIGGIKSKAEIGIEDLSKIKKVQAILGKK